MREDQIEALENVQRKFFPKGLLVAGVVGECVHTYVFVTPNDKEYESVLDDLQKQLESPGEG